MGHRVSSGGAMRLLTVRKDCDLNLADRLVYPVLSHQPLGVSGVAGLTGLVVQPFCVVG
jgi:hypothetical protein